MTATITLPVVPLPHFTGLDLPKYETTGSAGMDVRAALPEDEPMTLKPGARALVPTGLSFAIPDGFEMQVRPRSGLAFKHGITCLNTPGTIDSDYRGELKVLLINLGETDFVIGRGERVAQLIMAPVTQGLWEKVDTLPASDRGEGGFGSTGKS